MTSLCPKVPINSTSGVIYIAFDADGKPLYVGQTVDWAKRRREHMRGIWWGRAESIHFIPAFLQEERTRGERALIGTLDPEFNMYGTNRIAAIRDNPMARHPEGRDYWDLHWRTLAAEQNRLRTNRDAESRGGGPREVGLVGFATHKRHGVRADTIVTAHEEGHP